MTSDPWGELVLAIIRGTNNGQPQLPALAGPLAAALSQIDTTGEAGMLRTAALLGRYRSAGRTATTIEVQALAAPAEEWPRASRRAAAMLFEMLNGRDREHMPELLRSLAEAQRRVPAALLPDLLNLAAGNVALRPLVLAVGGARVGWLATQNPAWAKLFTTPDPLQRWEFGEREARIAALHELRQADPAHARTLLVEAWGTERAPERAALLATLASGLTNDDEPLLEAALDDRSREVRRVAAELLSQLPTSAFGRRMAARAGASFSWQAATARLLRAARPARIDVAPPKTCDLTMERDGIARTPPPGRSDEAWWVEGLVMLTPLTYWTDGWQLDPAAILAASVAEEWRGPLLRGWAAAARTQGHAAWLLALLEAGATPEVDARLLLEALAAPELEAYGSRMLLALGPNLADAPRLLQLMSAATHPWSAAFGRNVVATLRRCAALPAALRTSAQPFSMVLSTIAMRAPPALAPDLAAPWPESVTKHALLNRQLTFAIETLGYRRELQLAASERVDAP